MKKPYSILAVTLLAAAFVAAAVGVKVPAYGADPLQPAIAEKVLRFHVLADSDSRQDQELKLKVRDSVGKLIESKINNCKDLEEAEDIVERSMDEIIRTAEETLRGEGCTKAVTARMGTEDFPVKTYGDYTFPAGTYRAFVLSIGSGRGHNWWCVLYPNMCFRGSMYEVAGDEAEESLREVLSPEEYRDVLKTGNYKVHLKILDWFRNE